MFEGIAGHWIPVALSEQIVASEHRVVVASERVVLRREPSGSIEAAVEHRELGSAVRPIPVPAMEALGLVFVFTDRRREGRAPVFGADGSERARRVETWSMGWAEVMDELLVRPHRPLDPTGRTSRALRSWLCAGAVEHPAIVSTLGGVSVRWGTQGEAGSARLDWTRPNGIEIQTGVGTDATMTVRLWCVPVDLDRTRVFVEHPTDASLPEPAWSESCEDELAAPSRELVARFRRWQLRWGAPSTASVPVADLLGEGRAMRHQR